MDVDTFANSLSVKLGGFLTDGKYSIPDLQRNYAWSKVEAGQLWTDLLEHVDAGTGFYFLGNVVFYTEGQLRLVVDGQQRLATATILLCAVRDAVAAGIKAGTLKLDQPVTVGDEEVELRDHLALIESHVKKAGTKDRFFLSLKQNDAQRLAWIQLREDQRGRQPETRGRPKIYRAYELYHASAQALVASGRTERLCALTHALLEDVVITRTRVQNLLTAYTIFSTVNTRGKDLTLADIVRAEILARWQKVSKDAAPHHIISLLNQFDSIDYDELPQFIRRFWIARTGKKHSPSETSKKVVAFIREEAKTKAELTRFVQEAADFVVAYAQYLDISKGKGSNDVEERIAVFGLTRFQQHIPIIVSAILSKEISKPVMKDLLTTVESIYLYHNVLLESSPSEIEDMFAQAAHAAHADGIKEATAVLQDSFAKFLEKTQQKPEWFTKTFADADMSDGGAHFVLRTLEKAKWTGELKFKFGRPKEVHLEHILPQDPDEAGWDKKWQNEETRDEYLWMIGNLTLLADKLNQGASNSAFDKKKSEYYAKSELKLTRALSSIPDWNEKSMASRSQELGASAAAKWAWSNIAPARQALLKSETPRN